MAELPALGDVVVGVGAPAGEHRACDHELAQRGITPMPYSGVGAALYSKLLDLGLYIPASANGARSGPVQDGAFRTAAVFETRPDGVFAALQGRRVPARRHPLGIRRRIEELEQDHVHDPGSDLWSRRIEEIEAAGVALAAHRYAVGHAYWLGDPGEGVIVLPGSRIPERFSSEGVLPDIPREHLPATD